MKTDNEHWELVESIQLTPATVPLAHDYQGMVTARGHATGWFISARYRPSLTTEERADLADFVRVRTFLLLEHGPQPAPWERDDSGAWRAYSVASQLRPRERIDV
jgi:hypothetical protein